MYVLFIPSFPNNRFRLGNIRTKKTKKTKGEKREKEEEANVESLRYKHCGNFVTFFVLYFMNNCEMSLSSGLRFAFSLLFPFLFLSFLVFGTNNRVSHLRDWQRQRLALLSFLLFFNRKETRGAPGRFVFSRSRALSVSVFRVVDSFALVSFELQRARTQKWFGFCACAPQRKMCFYSERSFPCNQ